MQKNKNKYFGDIKIKKAQKVILLGSVKNCIKTKKNITIVID